MIALHKEQHASTAAAGPSRLGFFNSCSNLGFFEGAETGFADFMKAKNEATVFHSFSMSRPLS